MALHVGVDPARMDRGHPQPATFFFAERVGEGPQGELGRGVGAVARSGVETGTGVDGDYLTV
ncbi:hypothetical protein SDC9_144819 [bioreactor metagenome]|uniref:Uncharacterized protein n=1 Tax=bioreactor metagenome TaxID=1076179 RepID=A0A645E722_9ZZZZ